MPNTIKNDNEVIIRKRRVLSDGGEEITEESVGRIYCEATRELKDCTIQVFFNKSIVNLEEKEQIKEIFKSQFSDFLDDSMAFGWDILDIRI